MTASPGRVETQGLGARAILAAGLTGFACMAAELTAVRLLAPHFGDSAFVWTNVIGVILAAMAIGAALGGRLAGRPGAALLPFTLLGAAGLLLLLVPFLAAPLGRWLLPPELPLDAALPALVRGSFVATALLFAPPLLLLSAVSPLLVVGLARSGKPIGRAAGDIGAAGMLGSLAGTFMATHWLVPGIGSRLTLVAAAAALLAGATLVAPPRRRSLALVLLALALATATGHRGPLRPPMSGTELLAEIESPYQFLQVLRTTAAPRTTRLTINEGLDSFHSLEVEGSSLTGGSYYDWHAVAPLLAGDGGRPSDLRALSIGDAAGSLRAVYAGVHPGAIVDAVDIDAATMRLGDQFFLAPKAAGKRVVLDGRVFVALTGPDHRWHVIHLDAYAHQIYIPAHLASLEFFAAAHGRLRERGVLACNIGAVSAEDPVLRAVATTLGAVFDDVKALRIPASRNVLLLARRDAPLDPGRLAAVDRGAGQLQGDDARAFLELLSRCAQPQVWFRPASGELLRDDRPMLDQLLYRSYFATADPAAALAACGPIPAADAEASAYAAAAVGDWPGVLAAVQSAAAPTAYLRELAGDARWSLRQLRAALAEYDAALAAAGSAPPQRLAAKRSAAAEDAAAVQRAADAARFAGALAGVLVLAGAAIAAMVWRL